MRIKNVFFILLALLNLSIALPPPASPLLAAQTNTPPFTLPFAEPPGPDTWLLGQTYGNTTGAYVNRFNFYQAGQGLHFGMDFSAPCGTPIIAIGDGVVTVVDVLAFGSAPHNLMIDHPSGYASFYGHLLETPTLQTGQTVRQGDVIALTGDPDETCTSRPHLHLEIRNAGVYNQAFNPAPLIQADWDSLALIGSFGTGFSRDLNNPRQWQFLADQPDVQFWGPMLNDYPNPWPPQLEPMKTVVRVAYFVLFFLGITACAGQPALTEASLPNGGTPPQTEISPNLTLAENSSTPPLPNTPTSSPIPLITSSPSPTPIPALLQLTTNGCCVQPFFSPDSTRILFLDKPLPDAPTGFWSVPLPGGSPELYTDKLGIYSPDMQIVAYPQGGQTSVERVSDAQRWTIPNGGRSLNFSPNGNLVAWTAGQAGPPFDTALREIWISNFDGSNARQVATLIGGGFTGWVSETQALVTGRQTLDETESALWTLNLEDGSLRELIRGGRIRSVSISPGGIWMAYLATFAEDSAQNGIWLQHIETGERKQLDLFGGYRWRDATHLLIIPLDPNAAQNTVSSHQLWEVDTATGESHPLTNPAITPFKVASGDWTVSPDGRYVAFVSATDRNIWVLTIQP